MAKAEIFCISREPDLNVVQLQKVFDREGLTNRYMITGPIIEMTITRLEMMEYFAKKYEATYQPVDTDAHDILLEYDMGDDSSDEEFKYFVKCQYPKDFDPSSMNCDDQDYLMYHNYLVWGTLKRMRVVTSFFTFLYNFIFGVVLMDHLLSLSQVHPFFLLCHGWLLFIDCFA